MCLDQGGCHYFLRDASDGECRGYYTVEAGACESPYWNSNYYDLYQINYEPTPVAGAGGGETPTTPIEPTLPPSQGCAGTEYCEIGEKKECANA
jgi:hypothetical protein